MRHRIARTAFALAFALCGAAAHAQDSATVSPNENLVVDVPRIPASLAERSRVHRVPQAIAAGLASREPEMLINTRFANTPQVHRVVSPGGARTQLTFAAEPVPRPL